MTIADGVDSSPTEYIFSYGTGSLIPVSTGTAAPQCTSSSCQHAFRVASSQPQQYTVSVAARNVVGVGNASTPVIIGMWCYTSSKHHNSNTATTLVSGFVEGIEPWSSHLVTTSIVILCWHLKHSLKCHYMLQYHSFFCNRFNKQHLECDCWHCRSWCHLSVSEWPSYLCYLYCSVWDWSNICVSTKHWLIHWHQCQQSDSSTQCTTPG